MTYDNRIIAFIDILGVRALLTDGVREARTAIGFAAILREVIEPQLKVSVRFNHVKWGTEVVGDFSDWQVMSEDCRVSALSDSIVISFPELSIAPDKRANNLWSIYLCMQATFWTQRLLIQLGVPSRGAIGIGRLYHRGSVTVGSGLVTVYELERNAAFYPRTILDKSILDSLLTGELPDYELFVASVGNLMAKDQDGMYYIDYLGGVDTHRFEVDWPDRLRAVERFVNEEIAATTNVRVLQKLRWLESYVARAWRIRPNPANMPSHETKGAIEKRFPRLIPRPKPALEDGSKKDKRRPTRGKGQKRHR